MPWALGMVPPVTGSQRAKMAPAGRGMRLWSAAGCLPATPLFHQPQHRLPYQALQNSRHEFLKTVLKTLGRKDFFPWPSDVNGIPSPSAAVL